MEVHSELKKILAGAIAAAGYELWGTEIINSGKNGTLRIYIESEKGINVDDCAKASRQLSAVLEVEQSSLKDFTLEVSSPGMFRPLFVPAHYQQFLGEQIKLRLKQVNDLNRKNFIGTLINADDTHILLSVDNEEFSFDLDNIAQANLDPKF